MKNRYFAVLTLPMILFLPAASTGVAGHARADEPPLSVGRNINMVSGTALANETGERVALGGDPFLQRQNEPSIAVSTRNPMHLLAGANDYRTVDLPGLPGDKATGDSWLGLFKSFDGGQSWQSTLLPGFPQARTVQEGVNSPIHGHAAAADPTVRTGTNGMFYYSGIAFNRGTNALSSLFVARFIDLNNREGARFDVPRNQDPIKYLGTSIIGNGTSGQFLDKPWLAVDIPRSGALTVRLQVGDTDAEGNPITVAQSIPCGNVYLAYADFTGDTSKNVRTKILFARSTDCGATWNKPIMIDESFHISQGTNIAIGPDGEVYVSWRQFRTPSDPDAIVMARSTDFGRRFTKAAVVANINPFDQDTRPANEDDPFREFRTNSYPTMAVDGQGALYIAWSERGYWGSDTIEPQDGVADGNRVVYIKSTDGGTTWTAPIKVDDSDNPKSSQVMPAFAFAGGRLLLLYYDFRDDFYPDVYNLLIEKNGAAGSDLYPQDPSWPLADPVAFEPLPVRHTVDVRVAQVTPRPVSSGGPTTKVSKYMNSIVPTSDSGYASVQLQSNPVNLPLFAGGTTPFLGDYIDLAAAPQYVPDPETPGKWILNTGDRSPVFHAVWADNRNVQPPRPVAGADRLMRTDWTSYGPPGSCNGSYPGLRNQDIYTSRLTQGLVLGSYGNFKPLNLERAFSVLVENTAPESAPAPSTPYSPSVKSFQLTIDAPGNVTASFQPLSQGPPMTQKDVEVQNLGSVAVTVFAALQSGSPNTSFRILARELNPEKSLKNGGLESALVLNPDPTNPAPLNVDSRSNQLTAIETHDPEFIPFSCSDFAALPAEVISNCSGTTSVAALAIRWPGVIDPANPALLNPALLNPALLNPALLNPALLNPALLNPALLNPALLNPALLNPALLNPALLNPALLNPAPLNSALLNDAVLNPALLNPALLNPALLNPALLNASLLNSSPSGADLQKVAYNSSLVQGGSLDPTITPATLTDITWKVKNIGNDASSYFFTWFSGIEQKPEQIIIYRTYRTPLADSDCTLQENGLHYEFLANILQPGLLRPADLNSAVSFSLAPEDELYVTMRYLDPDGQEGPKGINPTLLSAQVLAQSANTNDRHVTVTFAGYSPVAPAFGDTVTLTAKVLSAGGSPTGNVIFKEGATVLGTAGLTGGMGSYELTSLGAGMHTLTAEYAGDGIFKPSASQEMVLTVRKASPTLSVTGGTFTYDGRGHPAVASAVGVGGATVPGSFSFVYTPQSGGEPFSSVPVNAGTYRVAAFFSSADPNYSDSEGTGSIAISKAVTTTTITSVAPEPSMIGQPVTISFAVVAAILVAGAPTGAVTVTDGTISCSGALTAGAGSCVLTWTTGGSRSLKASYSGDLNFEPSQTGVSVAHEVQSFTFIGFASPLGPASDPAPGAVYGPFNVASNVTIKWQVQDYAGDYVGDLSIIASLRAEGPAGSITLYDPSQFTTGSTVLRYDAASGENHYVFNWDVTKTPAGNYTLILELADGERYKVNVLTR